MIFFSRESREKRVARHSKWHTFFAVWPVEIGEGGGWAVLHTVQRRIKPDRIDLCLKFGCSSSWYEHRTYRQCLLENSK